MDEWTVLYEVIGCQIEIRENGLLEPKKSQILVAGFALFDCYIIWKSQGFRLLDMFLFIAVSNTVSLRAAVDEITGLLKK